MAVQTIGVTASIPSDNWELIASTNPAATTLNFTGISGYKKLMIAFNSVVTSGPTLNTLRLNNDSTNKYMSSVFRIIGDNSVNNYVSSVGASAGDWDTKMFQSIGGTFKHFVVTIENCDNTNLKNFTLECGVSPFQTEKLSGTGIYRASATISQVNLVFGATFNDTVYLYGVKA